MEIEGRKESPDRIIVVSEEILSRLRMSPSFLRRSGVRFLLVYSGPEALTLAGASDPAVVLLDYALPVLRADQVCREMKASPKLRDIPVVIAGPALPPEFETSCRAAGCDAFFRSPVDLSSLVATLGVLLGVTQRQEPRLSVLLSVSFEHVTSQTRGRSRDLSLSGIQVRTAYRYGKGRAVRVRFSLDETSPFLAEGEVIRCDSTEEGDFDLGIRFVGLAIQQRDRLAEFLERRGASVAPLI
ncbi:MAG TPA: PilZ domain-containing protein [Candidatus Polarisedimenticolia bacterium]|nr:PilZ domain-containing protein [Candidatus Polarisedimenticolia bacterium]